MKLYLQIQLAFKTPQWHQNEKEKHRITEYEGNKSHY